MTSPDTLSEQDVIECIDRAIMRLREKDNWLLQIDANERSITHRLAIYLDENFTDWDVDYEYNRDLNSPKTLAIIGDLRERAKGLIDSMKQNESPSEEDIENVSVYPDIIIHLRNSDRNFVVIEAKKTTNKNQKSRYYDILKLTLFKQQLNYKYAFFIDFITKHSLTGAKISIIRENGSVEYLHSIEASQ